MKKLRLLITIVDLFWYLSILAIVVIVGIMFYTILAPNGFSVEVFGTSLQMSLTQIIILYLIYLSAYGLLFYGLYLFRKLLKEFKKINLFGSTVIELLNRIGTVFIVAGVIVWLARFLLQLWEDGTISFTIIPNQLLVFLGIGLFFQVLAEIFQRAKILKDENELTI